MDITESVNVALAHEKSVTELFYEKFLAQHPKVSRYFDGVNIEQQSVLLLIALAVVEQYYRHRFATTASYLRILGARHERMQIPSDLYSDWRDCLLETLAEFHGEDWNELLADQWGDAIQLSIEEMLSGYESSAA